MSDDAFRWSVDSRKDDGELAARSSVPPAMIRAYQGDNKGATAFFRNRPFLKTFLAFLEDLGQSKVRVLFHAASVGAEPYSLALQYLHQSRGAFELEIYATDVNPSFLDVAKAAVYPPAVANGMTEEERAWFEHAGGLLHVPASARALVRFLPPLDFIRDRPEGTFDAVLIMNALTYVTADEQQVAIGSAGAYATRILALTAFHPDTIRRDLEGAGFAPHLRDHEAIHLGWGDRLSDKPIDPSSAAYSWRLPPYDATHPDCAYRYGSIFLRSAADGV